MWFLFTDVQYVLMYVVDFYTVSLSNGTNIDTADQDVVQMLEKAFHKVKIGITEVLETCQKYIMYIVV